MRALNPTDVLKKAILRSYRNNRSGVSGLASLALDLKKSLIFFQKTESPEGLKMIIEYFVDGISNYRVRNTCTQNNGHHSNWHHSNGEFNVYVNLQSNENNNECIEDREDSMSQNDKKINISDKRSWLKYPMGIEYSYLFPNKKITDDENSHDKYLDSIRKNLDLQDNILNIAKVYVDSGNVVEICSPVYRTWKEARNNFKLMHTHTKTLKLIPWSPKRGGGGGHINPSIPKRDGKIWTDYMYNLLVDVANRPYLGWIFNEPSDNHTAKCLWSNIAMKKFTNINNIEDRDFLLNDVDSRGFAVRVKDENHFEFRIFDMVRNERDLKDHLKFVSAYMSYIEKLTLSNICIKKKSLKIKKVRTFWKKEENYDITRKNVVTEFKKLLQDIGLDYKDYRRFVERNLDVRFNIYGKSHLV